MAEIEYCLEKMINYELREASNYATRSTIKMRALLRIMDMLDLSLSLIYETKNLIRIDVSCSRFIELLWKKYYGESSSSSSNIATTTNSFPTSEEWATLERFLAKDFVRNVDLIRLAAVLKKRLPEKDLNFIFAVDGLEKLKDNSSRDNSISVKSSSSSSNSSGSSSTTTTTTNNNNNDVGENINNLRNYFENLSVPIIFEKDDETQENLKWIHVSTIRRIYKRLGESCTPEKIGKVLKKIFGINFNTTTINNNTSNTETVLHRNIDENEKYSSSSDDDDDNDMEGVRVEEDIMEKNIETLYKNSVGNKLLDIASWKNMEIEKVLMKEMNRKRKNTTTTTTSSSSTTSTTTATDNLTLKQNDEEVRNKPGRPRVKDSIKKRKVVNTQKDEAKE